MAKGNGELKVVEALGKLGDKLDQMRVELNARLDLVNERLDKVIENTGKHWRVLEKRVSALERKVH